MPTSADGGRTWIRRLTVPAPVFQADIVSDQVWFAVTDGELLRTLDAGASWQPIDQPATDLVIGVKF